MEFEHTNFNMNRFEVIVRNLRVKQFHYSTSILKAENEIKCGRCNQPGHNKKNKSCSMHPSQPHIVFDQSDEENLL